MKTKRMMSVLLILILLLVLCAPISSLAVKSKTYKKTYSIFSTMGGYAKDSFVWECANGKIVSSSASQASNAVLIIYSVTQVGIKRTAKTNSYHEYQSVYRINVVNATIRDILGAVLKKKITFGYKEITATYRLNADGTFKVVQVVY